MAGDELVRDVSVCAVALVSSQIEGFRSIRFRALEYEADQLPCLHPLTSEGSRATWPPLSHRGHEPRLGLRMSTPRNTDGSRALVTNSRSRLRVHAT